VDVLEVYILQQEKVESPHKFFFGGESLDATPEQRIF